VIFGKTSHKGVSGIVKAAGHPALALRGIKRRTVASLTFPTVTGKTDPVEERDARVSGRVVKF